MKKIFILTLMVLGFMSFAQGIKFEEGNFKSLLEKAKKENKLIFVDAYTTWCGPCKLMAKNIFPLKSVGDYYNAHFINAKIDMEKGEGIEIAKKYKVKVFPTYLFINGDGEEVHRTVGAVGEKEFIEFAKNAQDPNTTYSGLVKKFEKGEKNPEFLVNLATLALYSDPKLTNSVLQTYFEGEGKITPQVLNVLFSSMKNTEDYSYQIFKKRKEEFLKFIPEVNYNQIDKSIITNSLVAKAMNKETKKFDEELFLKEAKDVLTTEETTKVLNKVKSSQALKNNDMATYEKLNIEMYKDPSKYSADQLNSIAWDFFEKVTTKSSLEKAILWATESVKKEENYANTDTLANLYKKIGDKVNAKKWALKAIELAKKSGDDYADTEKILVGL